MKPVVFLYSILLGLSSPLIAVWLSRRTRRQTGIRENWRQRFGFGPLRKDRPVWFHTASAGELQATVGLIRYLAEKFPIQLTTFTGAGLRQADRLLPTVPTRLVPLDLSFAWQRFLRQVEPRAAIFAETELWPNALRMCKKRGVPVILVSARLSDGTLRRFKRFPKTASYLLDQIQLILTQTEADRDRFMALGAEPGKCQVVGNLKSDFVPPSNALEQGRKLRAAAFSRLTVWVAASTHRGEEEILLEAFAKMSRDIPNLILILVPRHPERAPQILTLVKQFGLDVFLHSRWNGKQMPGKSVLLIDSIGILLDFYAAADIAFLGGTLVPTGGHNIREPAAFGVPILAGPYCENIAELAKELRAANALFPVANVEEICAAVTALVEDSSARQGAGRRALEIVSGGANVLDVTQGLIRPYLS